jgi:hypothetical protein
MTEQTQDPVLIIMLSTEGGLYSQDSSNCYPVQIAVVLLDWRTLVVIDRQTKLIKPWRFHCTKTRYHGILDKVAFRQGEPFRKVMRDLTPFFERADRYATYYKPLHFECLNHECVRQQVHFPWLTSKSCREIQPRNEHGLRIPLTDKCDQWSVVYPAVRNAETNINLLLQVMRIERIERERRLLLNNPV